MINMIEAAKTQIDELVRKAYESAAAEGKLPRGQTLQGVVEVPRDASMGDYACSYALAAAKNFHMAPRKIAEEITAKLDLENSYFCKAEVAGAGFINFRLSENWYREVIKAIEEEGTDYGEVDDGKGQRVMVEFVSANPTGTMTIGNARGGVLGDTMASILEKNGWNVWREFYVNDAGNQIDLFGKSLEARYIQLLKGEDAVEFPEDGYHGDDIKELAKRIRDEFGDGLLNLPREEYVGKMVRFGIDYNINKMKGDLKRYGISYDRWFLESELHESGYVAETVKLLEKNGYTYEKDGALWFKVTELGAEKDEVLRRSNGFYTYFAVDLAYHRNKFEERGFDKVIDVWGADHHGHAIRFKKSLPALNIAPEKLDFIIMQLVRLVRDGETVKVSKRTGKAISLADLLDEISCDAARFFFNARPDTHLEFDMDLAVREDSENPVYYVQYAHARICSLIEMLKEEGHDVDAVKDIDLSQLSTEHEIDLIKQLALLPEEIRAAARDYDPSRINRYLVELAARFHRFYSANRIRGTEEPVLRARLKLIDSIRVVLENCLNILGITAPTRM